MCKIKGKKIKRNSLSSLVPHNVVPITKSIGTLQNFGINDNKTTSQLRVKEGWAETEVGGVTQLTPHLLKHH